MFQATNNLTQEQKLYWVDNNFSAGLIAANGSVASSGYSMHLRYPSKDNKDPLNIAELLMPDGTQLAVHLIQHYGNVYNTTTKVDMKQANWLNIVHILLDNTVCYLEYQGSKYRTKLIVTRNLYLANALSAKPIANFDMLYNIISGNISYFDQLAISQPQLSATVASIKMAIINLKGSAAKQKEALEYISQLFNNCEIGLIKAYMQAYTMITQDTKANCLQGRCGLIKLRLNNNHLEMPTRIQATTEIPVASTLVPLDFMIKQASVITNALQSGIIFARVILDNNTVRDMLASHNKPVLDKLYGSEIANSYAAPTIHLDRGYISCLDICSSKIGGDLLRAISFARLQGISFIQPDIANLDTQLQAYGWHPSFPDTDFNQVIPKFKGYVAKIKTNQQFLTMLYTTLVHNGNNTPTFTSPYQVEESLYSYVDMQANLTSSFVRKLHLFMLANPLIFQGYTGKPEDLGNLAVTSQPKFQSLGTI